MFLGFVVAASPFQNAKANDAMPPEQGSSYSVSINDFDRDWTVFDSDILRGNDVAVVPLSGTTDAPDGARIEVRAISTDDGGASTTPWQSAGVASGGLWSGSVSAPRSDSWFRAQVRVDGAESALVETENRFGAGLVIMYYEQSNMQRGLVLTGDAPSQVIGANGHDFQVYRLENRGSPKDTDSGSTAAERQFITDDNYGTDGLNWMAAMYHKNAPGLKVMVLFDVKPGKSMISGLRDDDQERLFATSRLLIETALPDGQVVGGFVHSHLNGIDEQHADEFLAAVFLGKRVSGADLTPEIGPNNIYPIYSDNSAYVTHIWPELIPTLRTGRTQLLLSDNGEGWLSSGSESSVWLTSTNWRQARQRLRAAFPEHVQITQELPWVARWNDDDRDGRPPYSSAHFNVDLPSGDGTPLYFAGHAAKVLQKVSSVAWNIPRLKIRAVTASYIEFEEEHGRPITTREKREAIAESRAAIKAPTQSPTAWNTATYEVSRDDVLGFTTLNGSNLQVRAGYTTIVDDNGDPASSGYIRLYPPSGEEWDYNSVLYFARDNAGGKANFAEATWGDLGPQARFLPIVDVGLKGDVLEHGVWVEPPVGEDGLTDPDFIMAALADRLAPRSGAVVNTTGASYDFGAYKLSNDQLPSPMSDFTLEARLTRPAGNGIVLWGMTNNSSMFGGMATGVHLYPDGRIFIRAINNANQDIFSLNDQAIIPADTTFTLRVEYDQNASEARIYIDDVLRHIHTSADFIYAAGDLRHNGTTSSLIPSHSFWKTANDEFSGSIEFIRLWFSVGADGALPTSNIWHGLEAEEGVLVERRNYRP
ncbi:hypothetical protein [Qingshengfaniella alkalisoli]|uniref:Concanavalin A-like lectin/glucanase superfamily protein n=1 Tax=Qingshengfaniella alkalisoli TaxID=2599296 RepID=A0A5B8IXS0_9RHOB|nr:hypothetical protein [Qingshengfaniella alkalisoli]QDY70962.1 hypothetical protein FPZ52_14805 [Qingshengfaniella alkalisoli]